LASASTERQSDAADNAHEGAPPESAPARPPHSLWREYFESAIVTGIMALFFMYFVGQAAAVPSASMQNTILVGDHFLINKFIFAPGPRVPFLPQREIRRGDIIVFKYPSDIDTNETVIRYQTYFIKRVIGLPGDRLEVRGANILINGQVLPEHRLTKAPRQDDEKSALKILDSPPRRADEPYTVYYEADTLTRPPDDSEGAAFGFTYGVGGTPAVVPEGSYFVMGDNRDNSSDSRRWGFVPRELVVGRAMFVIWSYDEGAPSNGNFLLDFFKNTRWRRTGTFIK
jgi:signal peptidase I